MALHEKRVRRGKQELHVAAMGDGRAVVLLHSLFGTHTDLGWLAVPLAASFAVIAPDLRGRGSSSPAREVELHSFEEHAADVVDILDELDVARAAVVGSSFGAAVAVATVLREPDRVAALVLLAPAFGGAVEPMGEGDLQSYARLADRITGSGLEVIAREEAARIGSDRPLRRWLQHDEASVVAFLHAVDRYRPFDRASELEQVRVPALVMPGFDEIHTPALAAAYAARLPNARLIPSTDNLVALGGVVSRFVSEVRA